MAIALEVVAVGQGQLGFGPQQRREPGLALPQGMLAQIHTIPVQQVEDEEDQMLRDLSRLLSARHLLLQFLEARPAVLVDVAELAVEDRLVALERLERTHDRRQGPGPVQAIARSQSHGASVEQREHAIAVELHLV